jgi:Anti-sigma factor NepR
MRTDSDSPGEQVRTAISGELRQLYNIEQAQPLPDHLVQLLARLDAATEASDTVMQFPPRRRD